MEMEGGPKANTLFVKHSILETDRDASLIVQNKYLFLTIFYFSSFKFNLLIAIVPNVCKLIIIIIKTYCIKH